MEYMTSTGEMLKEYLQSRKITQKDLARMTVHSEKFISNIITSKARLTDVFALKLEYIMPDTKAEFWMNVETTYRLWLLKNKRNDFMPCGEDTRCDEVMKNGCIYQMEDDCLLGKNWDDLDRMRRSHNDD